MQTRTHTINGRTDTNTKLIHTLFYSHISLHYIDKHDRKTTNMMRSALSMAVFVRTVTQALTHTHQRSRHVLFLSLNRTHAYRGSRTRKQTHICAEEDGKKLNALNREFLGRIWCLGRTRALCVGLALFLLYLLAFLFACCCFSTTTVVALLCFVDAHTRSM